MNVLLIGKMASGKSHAAKFLIDKHGYKHLSLASPIKKLEEEFHNHTHGTSDFMSEYDKDDFEDLAWILLGSGEVISSKEIEKFLQLFYENVPKIEREIPKPRKRLQYIGTELGRKTIDDQIWIKLAIHKARKYFKHTDKLVMDDVRFVNEYESFMNANLDFIGLKLDVSKDIQRERLQVLYNMTDEEISLALSHDSEQEVDLINVDSKYHINADVNLIKMYKEIEEKLWAKN